MGEMGVSPPTKSPGRTTRSLDMPNLSETVIQAALGSVDEKDCDSVSNICDLFYTADPVGNKADPKCLRLIKRIASCTYIISRDIADYAISQDSKDDASSGYIKTKIGQYVEREAGIVAIVAKPKGYLWGKSTIRLSTCL